MPRSKPARVSAKVQPKLRMVANGSTEVNALRAEHASAVKVAKAVAPRWRCCGPREPRPSSSASCRGAIAQAQAARAAPGAGERVRRSSPTMPRAGAPAAPPGRDRPQGEPAHGRALGRRRARARATSRRSSAWSSASRSRCPTSRSREPRRRRARPRDLRRVRGPGSIASGEGVLVGIIDVGGFDFAHPDFLDADGGTRFVRIWDQGGDTRPSPAERAARATFDYGAELAQERPGRARSRARPRSGLPAARARAAVADGAGLARHARGQHRRRQPRRLPRRRRIAGVLISLPAGRPERRRSFYDSTPARPRGRLPARRSPRELATCRSRSTSAWAPTATRTTTRARVSRWIDAALDAPGPQRLRRGRQRRPGARPRPTTTSAAIMGRIHAERPDRRARARATTSSGTWSATASSTSPRTSSRSGTARRTASPCRSSRPGSDWIEAGRAAASSSRTASSPTARSSASTTSSTTRPTAPTTSPST